MKLFFKALFLLVLISLDLVAQDKEGLSSSYDAFTLYATSPTGDFSNTAKFGGGLGFDGAYYLHPMLGIAYGLDVHLNSYNDDGISSFAQDHIEAQPWAYSNLMLGLEISYPITPKIAPEFRFLGGLMVARHPEILINSIHTNFATVTSTLAYGISGGLKLLMNRKNALRIGIKYVSGSPEFERESGNLDLSTSMDIYTFQFYTSFAIL